ncbi:hypothetical protein FA95DRAFT_1412088 [Auriscalpium vulgare]|uniref:Uncharacterized protein n=1 Tax=Auriscalpium vulgare TaxID=40419 RepID=A0ACB8RPH3_9AGAM|nr:hypothetical protein FA95DRAFT_1412088 [Auriscalpium vulgare]
MRQKMLTAKLRTGTAPLSQLLYDDRPLLRPIKFVPSEFTPKLFMEEEEIFKPVADEAGEQDASHVPTAERVFRVFHTDELDPSRAASDTEELEEIDFADLGRVADEMAAAAPTLLPTTPPEGQETFTGIIPAPTSSTPVQFTTSTTAITKDAITSTTSSLAAVRTSSPALPPVEEPVPPTEEPPIFFVDAVPTPMEDENPSVPIMVDRVGGDVPLGDEDDDTIVYEAPRPRMGAISLYSEPAPPASELPVPFSNPPAAEPEPAADRPPVFKNLSFNFAQRATPRKGKEIESARVRRRRQERHAMFGSFGAIMSEAHLRDEAPERDPRRAEQRRGDSDVDWGDDGDTGVDEVSSGLGGMEIDDEISMEAMKRFAEGMSMGGSMHKTMDDIADEERMRAEDQESEESEDDEEVQMVVDAEESLMIAEPLGNVDGDGEGEDVEDEDEDEEASSDEDETPKRSFQARLRQLRERNKNKRPADIVKDELDGEEDDFDDEFRWSDSDEDDLVAQVQSFIDENDEILRGFDRKNKRRLFQAIQNGDFSRDDLEFPVGPSKRGKDPRDVPAHLRDQWARDRAKKAEFKRLREQARLEAAADPLTPKKGGKKGRKAMFAAAALDTSIIVPNRVVSMGSLEAQIRRFLADIGGPTTMPLPPMAKDVRANVHELALAFNLKSQSKGKGNGRYPVLIKTTRSGVGINERKVRGILRRAGVDVDEMRGGAWGGGGGGGGGGGKLKPKEGEVVGKAAPKIGESNVGFQMLAAMGWTEGVRIGVSGGNITVPLTAIVKTTKLGLGATRA